MTISDQGWAAITAYEAAGAAAYGARQDAKSYALRLMVEHLRHDHGMGPRSIAKRVGLKYTQVEKLLSEVEQEDEND